MQTTLQLNISDDLVQMFGLNSLQTYMQKRLEMLRLQLLADKISVAITESDMDWEFELENARKEVWNEYKKQNINK